MSLTNSRRENLSVETRKGFFVSEFEKQRDLRPGLNGNPFFGAALSGGEKRLGVEDGNVRPNKIKYNLK